MSAPRGEGWAEVMMSREERDAFDIIADDLEEQARHFVELHGSLYPANVDAQFGRVRVIRLLVSRYDIVAAIRTPLEPERGVSQGGPICITIANPVEKPEGV